MASAPQRCVRVAGRLIVGRGSRCQPLCHFVPLELQIIGRLWNSSLDWGFAVLCSALSTQPHFFPEPSSSPGPPTVALASSQNLNGRLGARIQPNGPIARSCLPATLHTSWSAPQGASATSHPPFFWFKVMCLPVLLFLGTITCGTSLV